MRVKSARTLLPLGVLSTLVHASSSTSSTRAVAGHQRGRKNGSATSAHTSSRGAATVRVRFTSGIVVHDKRPDVPPRQPLAPAQERELDHESAAHHLGAGVLHELAH